MNVYEQILALAADDVSQLRPADVDRVMAKADGEGIAGLFREWLLRQDDLPQATARAVRAWVNG